MAGMIDIGEGARRYLQRLIQQQGGGLDIRVLVHNGGTPSGECELAFCGDDERHGDDIVLACTDFAIRIDPASARWLEGARIDFLENATGGELAVRGGRVRLESIGADNEVVLRFGGGCQGCGMADVTLKQGVEKTLRERFPEITAVRDATDHAAGHSPYYSGRDGRSAVR